MLKPKTQFNISEGEQVKKEELDEAYDAKKVLDYAQQAINQMENKEGQETAQDLLDNFVRLCPEYEALIRRIELLNKDRSTFQEKLLEFEKERRGIHNQLMENLKNMSHRITQSGVRDSEWQKHAHEILLFKDSQQISLLALKMAKWKRIENK